MARVTYAEWHIFKPFMLNIVMLNAVAPSIHLLAPGDKMAKLYFSSMFNL
jgi:hypothetical protein